MSSANGLCPHNNQDNYCTTCAAQKYLKRKMNGGSMRGFRGNAMGLDLDFSTILGDAVTGAKNAAGVAIVQAAAADQGVQQAAQAGAASQLGQWIIANKYIVLGGLALAGFSLIYFYGKSHKHS